MQQRIRARVEALFMPLSGALVPLTDGLARQKMLHDGAEEHDACVGGVHIHYYHYPHAGAPPILCVHGIADSANTWAFMGRALARHHDVYAIDLPGYGLSAGVPGRAFATLEETRDLLAQFISDVIGQPALVAGNSLGGWLAVKLAWAHPGDLAGVVLINPGGAALAGRASWLPFAEQIIRCDQAVTRMIASRMFGTLPRPLLTLGARGLQERFQRQTVRAFVDFMIDTGNEQELLQPDELRQLPVPAALIWGLSDHFLPEGSLEFFLEHMPGAPKLLLRFCGHLPQRERPLSVAHFIHQFASALTVRPPSGPSLA